MELFFVVYTTTPEEASNQPNPFPQYPQWSQPSSPLPTDARLQHQDFSINPFGGRSFRHRSHAAGVRFSKGGCVPACVSRQGLVHQWFEIWKNPAPGYLTWITAHNSPPSFLSYYLLFFCCFSLLFSLCLFPLFLFHFSVSVKCKFCVANWICSRLKIRYWRLLSKVVIIYEVWSKNRSFSEKIKIIFFLCSALLNLFS